MNSKTRHRQKSSFAGTCNQCGEIYEAQSSSEDLGGIQFRCRKILCVGEVKLQAGASVSLKLVSKNVPKETSSSETPRRYC